MKTIAISLALCGLAFGQAHASADNFGAVGGSWNQFASPQVNGLAVYAHKIAGSEKPTYSFTAVTFLSASRNPFRVATTTETGIAQHLLDFAPFRVYGIGQVGVATSANADGTSVGLAYSGGAIALAPLGRGWTAGPFVRVIKPGTIERQWAIGLIVGLGR
jgi:hypothetical protein